MPVGSREMFSVETEPPLIIAPPIGTDYLGDTVSSSIRVLYTKDLIFLCPENIPSDLIRLLQTS